MENTILLDGVFRSGNTLLSSILNQNPLIHSTELSPMLDHMFQACEVHNFSENSLRNFYPDRFNNMVEAMFKSYYSDVKKPYIIYRAKHWMHPGNFELVLKHLDKNPKVIYTVRNTLDILASLVRLSRENMFLNRKMIDSDFPQIHYLPLEDAGCEYIMDSKGLLTASFAGLYNGLIEKHRHMVHFVHYDDLLNYPTETMDGIYKFLGMETYNHDFNSIVKIEKDNESAVGYSQSLHDIKPKLQRTSPSYKEVLSPYIIEKYKNTDSFWENKIPRIGAANEN